MPPLIRLNYQLDLVTPGISPRNALSRKQMRHIPNFLRKARGRPQMLQRLYPRTANFGSLFCLATNDFLAIPLLS
jgi:hypothetical protein